MAAVSYGVIIWAMLCKIFILEAYLRRPPLLKAMMFTFDVRLDLADSHFLTGASAYSFEVS